MRDFYAILGLTKEATLRQIKEAYHTQALENHPDKGGTEARMKELNRAYETLSDPKKRQEFDEEKETIGEDLDPEADIAGLIQTDTEPFSQVFKVKHEKLTKEYRQTPLSKDSIFSNFDPYRSALYSEEKEDENINEINEVNDLFSFITHKTKTVKEASSQLNLKRPLTPVEAVELFSNFLKGIYFGNNLIKIREYLSQEIKRIKSAQSYSIEICLYEGILEVFSIERIDGTRGYDLLSSLKKITDYAKKTANQSMVFFAPLFQSKYFRDLFSQALHHYWRQDVPSFSAAEMQAFDGEQAAKALCESYKSILSQSDGKRRKFLIRQVQNARVLHRFEQDIQEKEKTAISASGYRDIAFHILDWVPALRDRANQAVINNVILRAGIYLQRASIHEILPAKKMADERMAMEVYFLALEASYHATPNVALYVCVQVLKYISAFKFQCPDFAIKTKVFQRIALKIANIFPFFESQQNNVTLLTEEHQSVFLIRQFLHALIEIIEMNRARTIQIAVDHSQVTILYQAYEACLHNWYEDQNSSRQEKQFKLALMKAMLAENNWTAVDLSRNTDSPFLTIDRDEMGWMRPSRALPIPSDPSIDKFSSLDGIEINYKTGEITFLLKRWRPSDPPYEKTLTVFDLNEMLDRNIQGAFFSLEPVDPDKAYHPFNKMEFGPSSIYETQLLHTMLLTDYLLKFFTVGQEVRGREPYDERSLDQLLQNLPEYLRKIIDDFRQAQHKPSMHRFWIEAEEVSATFAEENLLMQPVENSGIKLMTPDEDKEPLSRHKRSSGISKKPSASAIEPSAEELAKQLAKIEKAQLSDIDHRNRRVDIPYQRQKIVIRVMKKNRERKNYYRLSVEDSLSSTFYNRTGEVVDSRDESAYIPIIASSYDDIIRVINKIRGSSAALLPLSSEDSDDEKSAIGQSSVISSATDQAVLIRRSVTGDDKIRRIAVGDIKMVVKKHLMTRDEKGNWVDQQEDEEGWSLFVLSLEQKQTLDAGRIKILGPAMIFIEGTNEVYFLENNYLSKTFLVKNYDYQLNKLFQCDRDPNGKIIKTSKNSALTYRVTKTICQQAEKPTYFSPEYVFAQEFTAHYNEFAQYFPEFWRLKELSRITALLKLVNMIRQSNVQHIRYIEELLNNKPHWSTVAAEVQKNIRNIREQFSDARRARCREIYSHFESEFSNIRKELSRDALYNKHRECLEKIRGKIGSFHVELYSDEVREAFDRQIEHMKSETISRHGYNAWDANVSSAYSFVESQRSEIARLIEGAKKESCRHELKTLYSSELAGIYNADQMIEEFLNGNCSSLAYALADYERSQEIISLQKAFPGKSRSEIEEALNNNPRHFISKIANETTEKNFTATEQRMNLDIARLERSVVTTKRQLQASLEELRSLESRFVEIGLGRRSEEIDLNGKCLWVPANVRHDVAGGYTCLVYGGVRITPDIHILDGQKPKGINLIDAAFSGPQQTRMDSSYIGAARRATAEQQGGTEQVHFLFHQRLVAEVVRKMQEAQARGVDIDAVRAGKKASEAMRPQSQTQPQQGAAKFKPGPTPPPTSAAGGRKPPSPPSSPRNRAAANSGAESKQTPVPPNVVSFNRPPSPLFWRERIVDSSGQQIQGLVESFRADRPTKFAEQSIIEHMNRLPIHNRSFDCSEITDRLYDLHGGLGSKLRITPKEKYGTINVPEKVDSIIQPRRYNYHYIYEYDGYIYDPRLSPSAIPIANYLKLVKLYNPNGLILDEELFSVSQGIYHRSLKI